MLFCAHCVFIVHFSLFSEAPANVKFENKTKMKLKKRRRRRKKISMQIHACISLFKIFLYFNKYMSISCLFSFFFFIWPWFVCLSFGACLFVCHFDCRFFYFFAQLIKRNTNQTSSLYCCSDKIKEMERSKK